VLKNYDLASFFPSIVNDTENSFWVERKYIFPKIDFFFGGGRVLSDEVSRKPYIFPLGHARPILSPSCCTATTRAAPNYPTVILAKENIHHCGFN
jgi:hypothetical protein